MIIVHKNNNNFVKSLQKTYDKVYTTKMAENRAFRNFVRNKKLVDDFNKNQAEDLGFVLSINK